MSDLNKTIRATDIELKDRLVAINRVTKVTKGGRHFSFSAIVVVGDEKNIVGHGLGKSNEVTEAIQKAVCTPGEQFYLSLDAASTEFYDNGVYQYEGKI